LDTLARTFPAAVDQAALHQALAETGFDGRQQAALAAVGDD
jgi:hypothetical protein